MCQLCWKIGQGGNLGLPIGPKKKKTNKNLVEDVEICLPVKFCWILFREVENISVNERPACFSDRPKNHKRRGRWDLASCHSVQWFQRKNRKCLSQSEAWRPTWFSDRPENIKMVLDVEILLPVNFRWIPFRGEVENASANQSPGRPSLLSDRSEKQHKFGRGCWDIAFCKVLLNSYQRRSRKCLSQSRPGGHLGFPIGPKKNP